MLAVRVGAVEDVRALGSSGPGSASPCHHRPASGPAQCPRLKMETARVNVAESPR